MPETQKEGGNQEKEGGNQDSSDHTIHSEAATSQPLPTQQQKKLAYTSTLTQQQQQQPTRSSATDAHLSRNIGLVSKFKGTNYVFDERMGARYGS